MREITHGRVGNVQICQESDDLEVSNESEERDGDRAGTRGQMYSFDKREKMTTKMKMKRANRLKRE
jgi:hypothetical protein